MSQIDLEYEVNPVAVIFASVGAIAVAGAVIAALVIFKPTANKAETVETVESVEVVTAVQKDEAVTVPSQGLIFPRTETVASSDVSGRVTRVSESFRRGASFKKGEVLLEVDRVDYVAALARAEAERADAELALKLEEAKRKQALRDWAKLGAAGEPGELVARGPQIESAKARLAAAEAAVEQAEHDLEQTALRAPYDGRIRSTSTNVGSYVTPGAALADMYSTDVFEVSLPLSLDEFNFVADAKEGGGPVGVTLSAANRLTWKAEINRIGATVDPKTRSVTVIAEVKGGAGEGAGGVAGALLKPGLFVEAEIDGRTLDDVVAIPRKALYGVKQNQVWVVVPDGGGGDAGRLSIRTVRVVRAGRDRVWVRDIEAGALVCTSPLSTPFENMPVRILHIDGSLEEEAGEKPAITDARS